MKPVAHTRPAVFPSRVQLFWAFAFCGCEFGLGEALGGCKKTGTIGDPTDVAQEVLVFRLKDSSDCLEKLSEGRQDTK